MKFSCCESINLTHTEVWRTQLRAAWHNKPLHWARKSETPFDWLSRWVVEGLDSRGLTFLRNHWSGFPSKPNHHGKAMKSQQLLRATPGQWTARQKAEEEEENQTNCLATTKNGSPSPSLTSNRDKKMIHGDESRLLLTASTFSFEYVFYTCLTSALSSVLALFTQMHSRAFPSPPPCGSLPPLSPLDSAFAFRWTQNNTRFNFASEPRRCFREEQSFFIWFARY